MGFLDDDDDSGTTTIQLKPGYWVEILKCLPRNKTEKAEGLLTSATIHKNADGTHATNTGRYRTYMVVASIVAWNLDDGEGENARVWDYSTERAIAEGVGRLPERYFAVLWEKVDELNGKRSDAEQAQFPDSGDDRDQERETGPAVAEPPAAGAVALAGTRTEPAGLPVSAVA